MSALISSCVMVLVPQRFAYVDDFGEGEAS
jgi:hypothetical protein